MADQAPTNPTPDPADPPDKPKAKRGRLMRLIGWKRREGGKRLRFVRYVPTIWGCVILMGLFGMVGSAAFAEYSMQPDFCRSCHLMEPYYEAWHESSHKNVPCTMCHFEPGFMNTIKGKWQASSQAIKYATKTYGSKPHAEVHDDSCMRVGCHERRLLESKVNWTVNSSRGGTVTIRFDHKPHLTEERRGQKLRCVSCHSQIVQGQHLVVTLDTCFLCHFKGKEHTRTENVVGGCKACHDAPKSEIRLANGVFKHSDYLDRGVTCENCHSDAVKGDGAVPRQVCFNCHNRPEQLSKFGEAKLIHDQHVSLHKVECTSCHTKIEHNLMAGAAPIKALAEGQTSHLGDENTCALCHAQTHGGPAELFRGTGGVGVPDMPSPMFRAQVDCIACHKAKQQTDANATVVGQTFVAVQNSCNYCHGVKYDGVLDTWRQTIKQKTDLAEAAYMHARKAVEAANLSAPDLLRANRLLDDADHNIRLVKLGHGVHNVNYSTALLSYATDNCTTAETIAGAVNTVSAGGTP